MSTTDSTTDEQAGTVVLPVPLCTAMSYAGPLPGQKHRSSGDFSTNWSPSGATTLTFKCDDPNAVFDVMEQKVGFDPTIWKDVTNNTTVDFQAKNLYIANPRNAATIRFAVEVWVT